jgi:hypothetical protein
LRSKPWRAWAWVSVFLVHHILGLLLTGSVSALAVEGVLSLAVVVVVAGCVTSYPA